MNLRERLRLMRPAGSTAHEPPAEPRTGGDVLKGQLVPTEAGPAFCIEHVYPLEYRRGAIALQSAAGVPEQGWRRLLAPGFSRSFSAVSAAFIDTETTGLGRGTGTYAFLVGIGRFADGKFRIRQFFMRDYHEELAILFAIRAELEEVEGVITFNGRGFDWPLLETRAALNRLALPRLPQLDILYPARRLWQPVLESCRLTRLEEAILAVRRHGDVPSHLIPQLYFNYLQTGDVSPLLGVMEHNRLDILTTAALAAYLGQAAADPLEAAPLGCPLPGTDLFGVGRLLLERGELAEGIRCLEEALERGLSSTLRSHCRRLLARAYRRAGDARRAAEVWEELACEDALSLGPYVELAKHAEHRQKDLEAARLWTLRALEVLDRRRQLQGLRPAGARNEVRWDGDGERAALVHRLRRIENKLARDKLAAQPLKFSLW